MQTKIGFVGNGVLENVLIEVSKQFTDVQLLFYFYKSEQESLELTLKAQKEVDVILFGGPVPYHIAKKSPDVRIPLLYISYDGAAFYRGLLHVLCNLQLPIDRISVDMISQQTVTGVLEDLNIVPSSAYVDPRMDGTGQHFYAFHKKLYEEDQIKCAITCVLSTYEMLQKDGIPSILVLATESAIQEGIQRAILVVRSNYFQKSQIAIGYIQFSGGPELTEYEAQQIHLDQHRQLVIYAKELHADIFALNRFKFVLYTTRGMFEKKKSSYLKKWLHELKKISQSTVHIGLGFGSTAQIAGVRAKKALTYCNRFDGDQCFLTINEGQMVNLFDNDKQDYRTDDTLILKMAQQYHLSAMVIKRVQHVLEKLGKTTITADELALELNQTIRNCRRILKEFEEKGLAKSIGEEHLGGKGRPKILYELHLSTKAE